MWLNSILVKLVYQQLYSTGDQMCSALYIQRLIGFMQL